MIERLKNCPNCAGILDEFGKCQFCGSQIFDLCDIDVRAGGNKRGKTYIRILTDNQIILAPIITNSVSIELSKDCFPTMNVEFVIYGETKIQEVEQIDSF